MTAVIADREAAIAHADRSYRLQHAQIITLDEARVVIGKESIEATRLWMRRMNINPVGHGRYPAAKIRTALALEARRTAARKLSTPTP